MSAPVERCGSMGGKVIFRSKDAARTALVAFRREHGHGSVVKCYPHDHWHLTKGAKLSGRNKRKVGRS